MKNKKRSNKGNTKKREERLKLAGKWLESYKGKHLIKAYSKHFTVDKLSAIIDLQMLGVKVEEKYIQQLKTDRKAPEEKKARKKIKREKQEHIFIECDDTFYYIAGYTSGGAPYGITWQEMGMEPFDVLPEEDNRDQLSDLLTGEEDMPF